MHFISLFVCSILATVWAAPKIEVVEQCSEARACVVSQIHFDICDGKTPCRFDRNSTLSLSVDFIPNFAATKLKSALLWTIANDMAGGPMYEYVPLASSDNACAFTSCPTEVGKSHTFNESSINVGKKFAFPWAPGPFYLTWKVWDEQNNNNVCCFLGSILYER